MEDTASFSLGIDIGTSYSCIAFCDLSKDPPYQILKLSELGEEGLIPSIILYDAEGRIVDIGERALDTFLDNSGSYTLAREFKAQFSERFPIGQDKYIEYSEAYEAFLKQIITLLRAKMNMTAGRVCITHPARKSSEDAIGPRINTLASRVFGEGFEVEGLDEASALIQFLDREEGFLSEQPRIVLVIDSGGGTTDFALAEASYTLFGNRRPLCIKRTNRADRGGRNIDKNLYLTAQKMLNVSIGDPVQREKDLATLRKNKEGLVWDETRQNKLVVRVADQEVEFSQEQVEEIARPEIEAMLAPATAFPLDQIDIVVLAGGNSLFPPFRKHVRKLFNEKIPIVNIDSEHIKTAVAKGASLYINRTNRQLKFPLGYSVYIYNDKNKSSRCLWKQGTDFPADRFFLGSHRFVDHVITDLDDCRIRLQREKEAPLFYELQFSFDPPIEPNTYIKARFEIDDNGYLRYYGEPFSKKNRSKQEIIRHFLFDTTYESFVEHADPLEQAKPNTGS